MQGLGNHAPSIVSSDAVTMRKATEELRELARYLHLSMSGPCRSHRQHSGRLLPPIRAATGHGLVPRARSHLCRTHWCLSQPQKTNSAMGLFCTVPTLRAEPLVYWGWERCPHSQAVPWDVAGRGEPLAVGFVSQGVPWLSLLSPANPRLQQAVHRPRSGVCPHLGKAGRKGRGGVILEVNGKID